MTKIVSWHIKNAKVLDVFNLKFEDTELWIENDKILYRGTRNDLTAINTFDAGGRYIAPGLIDSHLHIESSLLTPSEFGKLVLSHGITRIFADPHEIASVAGVSGIQYMLEDAKQTPLHIHYMLPSSVPATPFEHAGATLHADALKPFYSIPEINGLAEVMDFPAVANADPDMLQKIKDAKEANRHVDGHAAGLSSEQLAIYRKVGIDTDHESETAKEALERLNAGFSVFVREGTVERDEKAILPAITLANHDHFSFATDDKTASDIQDEGSIDYSVNLAIENGMDPAIALKLATYNAAQAHKLQNIGALADGFVADLIVFEDLNHFKVDKVMVDGQWYQDNHSTVTPLANQSLNFTLSQSDINLRLASNRPAHIINITPHHITTEHTIENVPIIDGQFVPNTSFAKIVVAERYHNLGHGVGIIKGFNLQSGAIASTIAHDSHNVIIAGVDDEDMILAANTLHEIGGGQVVVNQGKVTTLPLPIGGLMSDQPFEKVITTNNQLREAFSEISDVPFDPFLTLSFMALPVIPSLKITDQGLFDFEQFSFINIQD
ncbi:adenine deaminase [Leuconostoc litchii]|uniref:Adenine deaminase n=1 Tax=Leuconostoc litchii TaxID=1981069 RepID=A0A6P2CNW4_9LACO|nr:adenine deaminase [Leuconostoc litchii]TYC47254.1 adenine deaminase [Leuconostoc litchii]GMA69239.1 adenine deaminase [Leuconostoc litchii]